MKRVQMLTGISGGRGDGTEWPAPGGIIELDDEEARALVAGGLGRYAPEEERAVIPDDAETAEHASPPAAAPEGASPGARKQRR